MPEASEHRTVAYRTKLATAVKYWRGDYIIVFPGNRTKFHSCVICRRKLKFGTKASETGIGPECRHREDAEALKEKRLEEERRRYREQVVNLGFKIEG